MKIRALLEFGLSEKFINKWIDEIGDNLLPLQEIAFSNPEFWKEKNIFCAGPTSSGKSFIAEVISIKYLYEGKKVIYILPLKALAKERFVELNERYKDTGLKLVYSSREERSYDDEIIDGKFDWAVLIYEKFAQFISEKIDFVSNAGLLVIDEINMINDNERGPVLELAITKIKSLFPKLKVVALSSIQPGIDMLSKWLEAELIVINKRPVPLREGVLMSGDFEYVIRDEQIHNIEKFINSGWDNPIDVVSENVLYLTERGEQVLVFFKSRNDTVRFTQIISEWVDLPPARKAISEIELLEDTSTKLLLRRSLEKGVAFHNSDLTMEERMIVERAFRDGEVRVLSSTTTLAMGVNLPAQNVFLEGIKWEYDVEKDILFQIPLTRFEFRAIGGRAGRFRITPDFGRSILVAMNEYQKDVLWKTFIEGPVEPIQSHLFSLKLEDILLSLIASKVIRKKNDLSEAIGNTFWSFIQNKNEVFLKSFDKTFEVLEGKGAIIFKGENIEITKLGFSIVNSGLSFGSACLTVDFFKSISLDTKINYGDLLLFALSLREADNLFLIGNFQSSSLKYDDIRIIANTIGGEIVKNLLSRFPNLSKKEIRDIKIAYLLFNWMEGKPSIEIENIFGVFSGNVKNLAENVSWIVNGISKILDSVISDNNISAEINLIADRIRYGCKDDAIFWLSLGVPYLGRDRIHILLENGFGWDNIDDNWGDLIGDRVWDLVKNKLLNIKQKI